MTTNPARAANAHTFPHIPLLLNKLSILFNNIEQSCFRFKISVDSCSTDPKGFGYLGRTFTSRH